MAKFADNLITPALLLLGLVLMAAPLALWVAWTDIIFLFVLAACAVAGVLYCVLVLFEKPAIPAQSETPDYARTKSLPDQAIEELQKLHPFIHHHRPTGGPKFRAAMFRLKLLLYRRPD